MTPNHTRSRRRWIQGMQRNRGLYTTKRQKPRFSFARNKKEERHESFV